MLGSSHSVSEAGILFARLSAVAKCGTIASLNFNRLTWNFLQGYSIFSLSLAVRIYFWSSLGLNWPVHELYMTAWTHLPLQFPQGFSALYAALLLLFLAIKAALDYSSAVGYFPAVTFHTGGLREDQV